MVIWLIGLSAAGKTAIGREVQRQLRERGRAVVFLDGDRLRQVWGDDLGHTLAERRRNADRICRLGQMLEEQELTVVCAILSIFPESRAWNRAELRQYFEVYVRVPFEVLVQRDSRGLYRRALAGEIQNVAGVDLPFPVPESPDLILDNAEPVTDFNDLAAHVVQALPEWE